MLRSRLAWTSSVDQHAGVKNNAAYISLVAAIFAAAAAGSGWYHAGARLLAKSLEFCDGAVHGGRELSGD